MQETQYTRTEAMLGKEGVARLRSARVAIFGIGGVGGYAVEALARAGVGSLDLIDADKVSISNINRQIIATNSTVGKFKTEAARERISEIDKSIVVTTKELFFDNNTSHLFNFSEYDYVIDAIDSVKSKIEIIALSKAAGVPVISSMGAGNKLDPTAFRVADISKTSVCPLARAVRSELKRRGISDVKVVYSEEKPIIPTAPTGAKADDAKAPASISFVPSVVGLIIAGEVIKDIALK